MKGSRWAVFAVGLVAIGVAAVCIRLGFWQLDRLDQRRQFNAAVIAAGDLPPVLLSGQTNYRPVLADPDQFLYRPAVVRGSPVREAAVLLRGRSDLGRPGVHLAVPITLADGEAVMVNYGWLPAPDAASVDPRPYLDDLPSSITGILMAMPPEGIDARHSPVTVGDTTVTTLQRLDRTWIESRADRRLLPLYVERTGEARAGALPRPVPPVEPDDGPHLSYAVQWFSFAAIALGGFVVAVVVGRRKRISVESPKV